MVAGAGPLDLRLRVASPGLLALPWARPLAEWDTTEVDLLDLPVGPSRHLVRFVACDGRVWALKDLPPRLAVREYDVLRTLEDDRLTAVRPAGIVVHAEEAILVTHYLERSWQYRRLLLRLPASSAAPRARLMDAMAGLLVDLHRHGVFWGDCSLANTLFRRDGQRVEAWLVDAETAEVHPQLSDGQRRLDLELMEENVVGGLLDVAARRGSTGGADAFADAAGEAEGVVRRYEELWSLLHDEPVVDLTEPDRITDRVRGLNELGFSVDEVHVEAAPDETRLRVAVGDRRFHADELFALTGLEAGEGQAAILLADLRSGGTGVGRAAQWLDERFLPAAAQAHAALGHRGDPVQAYCDLLEVRWLLSEAAGRDVGDAPALAALRARVAPEGSAAQSSVVELPTEELPVIRLD